MFERIVETISYTWGLSNYDFESGSTALKQRLGVFFERLLLCYIHQIYRSRVRHIIHKSKSYKNLVGGLFLTTNGCLCTLGIRPSPIALRIAFAIFLWFFGLRPVSLDCFIRPVSVMYSDMIVKF